MCIANLKVQTMGTLLNNNLIRKVLLVIISMVVCQAANAQTNYYNKTKTFHEEGYTYHCDYTPGGLIRLYNRLYYYYVGKWVRQKFKETGEVFYLLHYEKEDQTYDDDVPMRIMDRKIKRYQEQSHGMHR